MGIVFLPTQYLVKKGYKVNRIIQHIERFRRPPVEHVEQTELEIDALALDDDIVAMQVTVVVAQLMNLLKADRQCVKQV